LVEVEKFQVRRTKTLRQSPRFLIQKSGREKISRTLNLKSLQTCSNRSAGYI